ncbi:MAG: hypothetical protein CVV10_00695 [Gammaproteobacteria bacterium HGW-Gammaproteobacteria-14]|nr:MAG: hypothetical protein CVV10_00695 [Gammaproteobacteria bacterium HGW-Gammaproteobacteria-14]
MIGNRIAWGSQGFSILEEGEINRQTLALEVTAWLVCRPDGEEMARFSTLEAARQAVEQQEPLSSQTPPQ